MAIRASDDSLQETIIEVQSFPFLRLPAELRNRIYELATPEEKTWTPLKHVTLNTNGKCVFFGLAGVCKQVRTEYAPLLFSSKFRIRLVDLAAWVTTFYEANRGTMVKPLDLDVAIGIEDIQAERSWDKHSLSKAKATTRGLRIQFSPIPLHGHIDCGHYNCIGAMVKALYSRFNLLLSSRKLERDIESGYIRASQLRWRPRYGWRYLWNCTVQKKSGGLRDPEIEAFRQLCFFALGVNHGAWLVSVAVTIKVQDFYGKHIEEYWFDRCTGKLLRKKIGRDWLFTE